MLFKPNLLDKIRNSEKTQTRRMIKPVDQYITSKTRSDGTIDHRPRVQTNGYDKWIIGGVYAACPGRGQLQQARFQIIDIRPEVLSDITESDARREGFASRDEFLAAWDKINGAGNRDVMVWVIDFVLTEVVR